MVGIYIITNKVSGHRYIGQSRDIKRRFAEHRTKGKEHNYLLDRAFKKYGYENFSYEVLEECDASELDEREMYYIAKLKPEYNRTAGGVGCKMPLTEEQKEHLRQCGKRQWANMTEEQKRSVIENNLKGPRKGHPVSEKARKILAEANRGKHYSEDSKAKRKATMEAKGILPFGGKRYMTPLKPVRCIETGETFESITAAEEKHHLTTLCGHLKGKYATCKGLHYEYLSVETTRDECSGVGPETSCGPKCAAHDDNV